MLQCMTKGRGSILKVTPGITDIASIEFRDENSLLAKSKNPEETYKKRLYLGR